MFVDFASGLTPLRVISSYRLLSSPVGIITRQSGRKCWGIALKAGGRTFYSQNGDQILSDRYHIVLLPKGAVYEWTCVEPGECIVIDFDALETGRIIRSVEVGDPAPFLEAFFRLERCAGSRDTASYLESMQLLYGLLAFLSKMEHKKYVPRDKRDLLAPAVEYMTANYQDPVIRNESLAALCHMSTVYFRKTFEAVYGISPIRYLNRLRIEKAKAMLSGDYDSVSQVAESVGYSGVYHFSKMFRQYTGQSPTQYAKSTRK